MLNTTLYVLLVMNLVLIGAILLFGFFGAVMGEIRGRRSWTKFATALIATVAIAFILAITFDSVRP